ncbi:ATP-binding protein [Caballeronia cordobensis]|uniref:ATP-binding protein n=1 Tax=Caballeronia cordobensis TaxID=1353886 RepID=UPI0006AD69ED|nr:ATP-binding protein [Caballeronia cordobensis]
MTRPHEGKARWFKISLRGRLLLWLLPTTILVGFLASGATYLGALVELDELLNDQLRAIAQHVSVDLEGRFALSGRQGNPEPLTGREPHGVLVQVWDGVKLEFSSDPSASLPPPHRAGLVDLTVEGQTWHTFVSHHGDLQIRVAQVSVARWAALAEIAVQLLWPVLSIVPVLALFLWFGIGHGLKPLKLIAAGLARRNANNMGRIDTYGMPGEVKPLVDEINDLLVRLEHAFTGQKNFIADAAHELRTPIMGLSIQVELLSDTLNAQERLHITRQIQTGTQRLAHLAEQLLTLARVDPEVAGLTMSDLDLCELASAVIGERAQSASSVAVDLGLEGDGPVIVQGNEDALRMLLSNLIDNAIRYAGVGARVDVVVRRSSASPILEVRDDGPGIPEAERARVWERFYRGNGNRTTGSGLGLSIVRRIAEQHRATVSLHTFPDERGLLVRVDFPS